MSARSKAFVDALKARRSVHQNTDKPILGNDQLLTLIKDAVKYSPSAFNSQSTRAVVLLGESHKNYWSKLIAQGLQGDHLAAVEKRLPGFAAAQGTVLFFEDRAVIDKFRGAAPVYSHCWDVWSPTANGMAQINVWTALEAEGYGANLQHVSQMAGESFKPKLHEALKVPSTWDVQGELVFGARDQAELKEKTFIDDSERFIVHGA